MAWRFVQQPNGRYARFSEIVDNFTEYDMTPEHAVLYCMADHGMTEDDARFKVQLAVEAGAARWRETLGIIRQAHGEAVLRATLDEITSVEP